MRYIRTIFKRFLVAEYKIVYLTTFYFVKVLEHLTKPHYLFRVQNVIF